MHGMGERDIKGCLVAGEGEGSRRFVHKTGGQLWPGRAASSTGTRGCGRRRRWPKDDRRRSRRAVSRPLTPGLSAGDFRAARYGLSTWNR